jgi:predicted patatin/cPLA2 family phospholipase
MKDKIAIVIAWWWMGASYWVWCVLSLVHEYWITNPDIVIAWSGNTGTMSYYVAKQYGSIRNIRSNLLSTKKFINFRRFWKIIDIDYLIDDVFKKQDPLHAQKIYDSKINYYISVTNNETWKVEYLSNHDEIDVFEAMRASKAMPTFYGKIINIQWKEYVDTPNSTAIELKIKKAIELWANKIIIIDSWKKTPKRMVSLIMFFKSKKFKQNFRKEYYERKKYIIPKNIETIIIKPDSKLNIWILQNDKHTLVKMINQWYKETTSKKIAISKMKPHL